MANGIETPAGAAAGGRCAALGRWFDERIPGFGGFMRKHLTEYMAPKNFNFWYFFGSLAIVVLVIQVVSGIFLAMNYTPSEAGAFASVEFNIMREVNWGWLIRYMHAVGASAFFIVIYLHMFRGLLYGSYKKPRELVWLIGMLIYVLLMAEGFFGYVLPWGNMSYWGAQVIVSLASAIPGIGDTIAEWVRGDYSISEITLNRFFALHVVAIPLLLIFAVFAHIMALHEVGSNNPDGVEIKKLKDAKGRPLDGIAFHPYYTYKDMVGVGVFLMIFCGVVFFAPTFGGLFLEKPNFEPANPLNTPEHIAPVWYFTPYYAILRAVPDKLFGALLMGLAIVLFFFLPWLDRCKVKSIRYRGLIFKVALTLFAISFVVLAYLGLQPAEGLYVLLARIFTVVYFAFFLLMPIYTRFEKTRPVPERVTTHA